MGALEPLLGAGGLGVLAIVIVNLLVADFRNRRHVGAEINDAEERALRRAAEDREAKLGREVAALSEKVEALSSEVALLRESVK